MAWPDTTAAERSAQERPTVVEVLRRHAAEYVRKHARQAVPQVQNVLARLSLCRTRALGGHRFRCDGCGQQVNLYNSCGDRHCPGCSGARRSNWLDSAAQLLLPGVDYFQVVFTLPEQLSALALGNRRQVYNLLFLSAWEALRDVLREELGIDSAATMVLHTWNQRLEQHAHIHALVPGGGPSLTGEQWTKTRHKRQRRRKQPYLVDNKLLGQRFRAKFIAGIKRLHAQGELKLIGEWSKLTDHEAFDAFLNSIAPDGWVVFIEPPPTEDARPENVLKYLARYMAGGPISDRRLISHDGKDVLFWARSKKKQSEGTRPQSVPVKLSAVEFTRRWALHILPKGFVKVRSYGGYSNINRKAYLERCRRLLGIDHTDEPGNDEQGVTPDLATETNELSIKCPDCHRPMTCIVSTDRPSWSITMHSSYRPPWYHDD